jgi:serine/threonine-protein kinase RsbW
VATQTLVIDSRTDNLIAVRDFITQAARDFGFGDVEVANIVLAVDEACTNIIKHGYKYDATKTITIVVIPDRKGLELRIRDNGIRFDPRDITTPDMKEYFAKFRRGGLGVYLMKRLMDEVEYIIRPGEPNEVRLMKYLNR